MYAKTVRLIMIENLDWVPIPGYEDLYCITKFGNIKSLDKYVHRKNGVTAFMKSQEIKHRLDTKGYSQVNLYKNGIRKTYRVYILLALTFIGPCPKGLEVRHLDDDKSSLELSNLSYGTRKENAKDRIKNGIDYNTNKTHCPRGHKLEEPNLVPSILPGRGCLSCHRAHSKYRSRNKRNGFLYTEEDIKNLSDANYKDIMGDLIDE